MKHLSPIAASLLAIVFSIFIAPTAVRAQSATAQAETLFRQGKDLLAQGRTGEACAAFDASQKLDPTIATLLNQASCREKNGQLATAWGLFLEAERESRAATDDAGRKLHQVAVNHAAKLEPRLSTLTLVVAPENRIGGLEILRGTERVDAGAWNRALPIDGGTYKITARAPGNTDWSSTITVGPERDARTMDIPRLKAAALQPTRALTAGSSSTTASQSRLAPLLLGGASLALVGTAIGLEISARSTYDRAKREPDDPRQDSLWRSANTRRYIATGLGVAGLATAGVATWLYLRGGSEPTPSSAQAARLILQPIVGRGQAGLVVEGSY